MIERAHAESSLVEDVARLLQERLDLPVVVSARHARKAGRDIDAVLRLGGEAGGRELWLEVKETVGSRVLDALQSRAEQVDDRLMLAAPSLPRAVRDRLRAMGVNHADLAGNVFVREPGFFIWLDADRTPPPASARGRSLNPFSKRSSLVLRALLEHPRKRWKVRELSADVSVSVGHTSDIVRVLVERGYADEHGGTVGLGDAAAALRDWMAAYDWRKNIVDSYVVPFEYDELLPAFRGVFDEAAPPFALTLLAGAGLVAPHVRHEQLHAYVAEQSMPRVKARVRERLFGEPVQRGGNLHLLHPYHGPGVFYGRRTIEGFPVCSNVQLFLDLAAFPLRGAEAARILAKGALADQLQLSPAQVRSLTEALD